MSKSPKRPASSRKSRKPVTIELEAEVSETQSDAKSGNVDSKSSKPRQSTPRVGRDAATESDLESSKPESAEKKVEENEAVAKPDPAAPMTDQSAGKGSGGRIAAGLVGGLLALGGGAGLQYSGYLPNVGQQDAVSYVSPEQWEKSNSQMMAQIASLQAKLDSVEVASAKPDASALSAAIDARLAERPAVVPPEVAGKILDIENRTISLETSVSKAQVEMVELSKTLASSSKDTGDALDLAAVQGLSDKVDIVAGDVARLKQEVGKETIDPATVVALGATVAALQTQIGNLETNLAAVTTKTATLPESILGAADVETKIENSSKTVQKALQNSLSAVQSEVGNLSSSVESQQAAIASVQDQLANGADKRAAKALMATQLKSLIDRGEPYADTLATLKTVSENPEIYAVLEPFSQTGVPTKNMLKSQFDSVSEEIANAISPPQNMSLTDRLLAGAKSMVKVKPINGESGDGFEAIVSRIDTALRADDLAKASEYWNELPEAGKTVSQPWFDAVQARKSVDVLLNTTVQNLISSAASN